MILIRKLESSTRQKIYWNFFVNVKGGKCGAFGNFRGDSITSSATSNLTGAHMKILMPSASFYSRKVVSSCLQKYSIFFFLELTVVGEFLRFWQSVMCLDWIFFIDVGLSSGTSILNENFESGGKINELMFIGFRSKIITGDKICTALWRGRGGKGTRNIEKMLLDLRK